MPDLAQSLGRYDLGYLQIVAELWGIEFTATEFSQGIEILIPILLDSQLAEEMVQSLSPEAQAALADLVRKDGRMTWSFFTRRYGEVREMGSGRRDRARPYLDPISTAEVLFYRALIDRTFFDSPSGPEEFAYIPDDLMPLLDATQVISAQSFGRAALPAERAFIILASDRILAEACTMLAALRMGLPEDQIPLSDYPGHYPLTPRSLKALLSAANLLDADDIPVPEPTRSFLEAERGQALAQLANNWQNSKQLNELTLLPQLILEGEWSNDPLLARESILKFLANIPAETWWNIESFINAIHEQFPDFQRPAGDYDSWFIRHAEHGEYLRGFENWDQVDGELIHFLITGPLHWLGILDLAAPGEGKPLTAFRLFRWSDALLQGVAPQDLPLEDQKILVRSDARLMLSTRVPRSVRYQIARFSEWDELERETYHYRITPPSLRRASKSGLLTSHLLSLLHSNADLVPPNLVTALERWDEHGRQARMEQVFVLRLSSPEILQELRASRAARFLGDPLGPTAVIVKPGAREKVLAALAEMGYLGEIISED
ncbi:MAG: helicase-associated domain-containing protein [Chloroflexi bacterium]|nr:helicase-associated domain-containing protein [Chloroflexota bacterium]